MNFKSHYDLKGKHAILSPSTHRWINYTPERIQTIYENQLAVARGTKLHAYAEEAIRLNRRQLNDGDTVNTYINDAIMYQMEPEVLLYGTKYCFGTADAIKFENGVLRVHDLKTGTTKASMEQLHIYCALFCMDYDVDPRDIDFICRIYQSREIYEDRPPSTLILEIVEKIKEDTYALEEYNSKEVIE